MAKSDPGLYGISASNRKSNHLWSKNRFNSCFPMSLCCWLRDEGKPVLCIRAKGQGKTAVENLSVNELFNLRGKEKPYFNFERAFEPYKALCRDEVNPKSDVVIHVLGETGAGESRRALEVKLTVVPDTTTVRGKPESWAPEIVFRPATLGTATLGLFTSLKTRRDRLKALLRPVYSKVKDWSSVVEAGQRTPAVLRALQDVIDELHDVQQPLIVQPIWRTNGKHALDTNAFDVFVWSDVAFLQLVVDVAQQKTAAEPDDAPDEDVRRQQRAALQMFRTLYELASSGEVSLTGILKDMGYRKQSDKSFSVSGKTTGRYLNHPRLVKPAVPRDALRKLFVGDGQKMLQPERRLDATIYFTWKDMFPDAPLA